MESQGFDMKKKGKDYFCCCPFHDDKTPSLSVTPSKNMFNCFSCDKGGSVIDWVKDREGISFTRAVEILQHDVGVITDDQNSLQRPLKKSTTKQLPSALVAEKHEQQALNQVVDYYQETLKSSPDALAYLDKRGLNDPELIERFKLGYANRTLGYRLPKKDRQVRGQLQRLGICGAVATNTLAAHW
ncbi:MAG: CHC2 zinc finger domain-containing protein [Xanthomonadales bacterium]|nr:CHC2 zinc finger domain-containing protein [Xanthomonadales bacterium]